MQSSTLTDHPLAERGRCYGEFTASLRRRGEAALHAPELDKLLDAADALLFDEPEAEQKAEQVREMLESLVESGRWTETAADDISQRLTAISGN